MDNWSNVRLCDVVSLVLSIVFAIYCGVRGNQWHLRDLERKGYVIASQT